MKMREILYIHHELITVHGVTEGPNGESFIDMDYQSLVHLLAPKVERLLNILETFDWDKVRIAESGDQS